MKDLTCCTCMDFEYPGELDIGECCHVDRLRDLIIDYQKSWMQPKGSTIHGIPYLCITLILRGYRLAVQQLPLLLCHVIRAINRGELFEVAYGPAC